jgi:hypothetical protein
MRYIARSAVAGAVVATLLAFGATASAQNKCLAGKNKCGSKKMQGILKCYSKAAKDPANQGTVFTDCFNKAVSKYDGGTDPTKGCFAKLEVKNDGPCLTTNDSGAIETKVDNFTDDVVTELLNGGHPPSTTNACQAGKDKCVLKKAAGILKCHEKCAKDPLKCGTVRTDCINKAIAKFDGGTDPTKGCFAKLEAKGGCLTTSDTGALETKVDNFVTDVLCELGYASTGVSCGPTPTPTPTLTVTPTPTVTPTCAPGPVFQGALPPTVGRFNYNLTLGLPGANSACGTHFGGSHVCTVFELQCGQAAGSLMGAMDTPHCQAGPNTNAFCTVNSECPSSTCGSNPITSFWAVDPAAPALAQCLDDVSSFQRWEYATAHTMSRGQKLPLNNGTGMLGALQTGLQCNLTGSSNVGCCQ